MKTLFQLLIVMLLSNATVSAQYFRYFPHGLIISDIPYYDYNSGDSLGVFNTLVNEGQTLFVIHFSLADTAAWNYHSSGALQALYQQYGPLGSNQIKVIALPFSASDELLSGQDPASQGNWLENMPYPVRVSGWFQSILHAPKRPLMFCICPNKRAYKVPFVSTDSLATYIGKCDVATEAIDARILQTDMDTTASCAGQYRSMNTYICNMGTSPPTEADIITTNNGQVISTYHWTGNLNTYQYDKVNLSPLLTHGFTERVQVFTALPNGQNDQKPENDTLSITLGRPVFWNDDKVILDIDTDPGVDQFYWDAKSSNGTTIDSGGNFALSAKPWLGGGFSEYTGFSFVSDTIFLSNHPQEGITLRAVSGQAYGVCCEYGLGYVRVRKGDEVIWDWTTWNWMIYGKLFTTFGLEPLLLDISTQSSINGAANGSVVLSAIGGQSAYSYSIDCGETYSPSPVFSGLLAGTYCVAVMDSIGQIVMDTVVVDDLTGIDAALYGQTNFSIQPNPTKDQIQVSLSGITDAADVKVQLLNAAGQVVLIGTLYQHGSTYEGVLSLSTLPSGVYFVRATAPQMTRVAKVVKAE